MSSANTIHRGIDEPPEIKYKSLFKGEYVKPSERVGETTAQVVGVDRKEDSYSKVSTRLAKCRTFLSNETKNIIHTLNNFHLLG